MKPDLIHAHFATGGRTAVPLAKALKVPLVVTLHGSDVTVRRTDRRYFEQLWSEAMLFLCVSCFIHESALGAGFPAAKLRVHYIGIDCQQFAPSPMSEDAKNVLFVGRLVEKKGCEYLIRAMQIVQQRVPEAQLVIVGDGPLRKSLQALSQELGVQCDFRGAQSPIAIREAFRRATLFCVPSVRAASGDSEGLGIVFAEAQAMGVPVVGTRHGGIPEIVEEGVTGWLVPERDHQALAVRLLRLLQDRSRADQFGLAARLNITKSFDLIKQTAELETVYSDVIERGLEDQDRYAGIQHNQMTRR